MKAARLRFYEEVLARGRCYWAGIIDHECDGPTDAMHIIPKQWLKNRFQYDLEPEQLADMVYSPLIGAPGCRRVHGLIDGFGVRLGVSQLPEDAVAWSYRHQLDWKLRLLYPKDELENG